MKSWFKTRMQAAVGLLAIGCLGVFAGQADAQAPANSSAPQNQTQNDQNNPAAPANKPKDANPFPDDTNTVPVLPSANSPGTAPSAADDSNYSNVPLSGGEGDPVKSPDDAPSSNAMTGGSSSSSSGMDNLLKPPPDEPTDKHRKLSVADQPHTESAQEDETVGSYYLDQKNWKAALSRFESAVVLDPENPDVYWGLAEAQRHSGDLVSAKANYLKVMEYDPDSKHSKEAKKILKDPEMANAKSVSKNSSDAPSHP